jgi:hypothetical protein
MVLAVLIAISRLISSITGVDFAFDYASNGIAAVNMRAGGSLYDQVRLRGLAQALIGDIPPLRRGRSCPSS